jgi:homoserine kinase type II
MLPEIPALLAFGLDPHQAAITPLGDAGGFSGSQLWRVRVRERELALRRWPAETDETRVRYIHALQEFAGMQLEIVPRLQRTTSGDTVLRLDDGHWELANWLPGVADFQQHPTDSRLVAAMQALARLHIAWEHFPTRMTGLAPSPAMISRRGQLAKFEALLPQLRSRLASASTALQERGYRILDFFQRRAQALDAQLQEAAVWQVPLQPCLRDIWHDHVLFTGELVTGVVDFGAARIECVAGDIARLVGSLVGSDPPRSSAAVEAYEQSRRLTDGERRMIPIFDQSSVAMSGMQWLQWLLIDGRQFQMQRVLARLDEILARFVADRTPTW